MANEKIPLMYKGHPLRRKDNLIYYGSMADPYIVMLQILDSKYSQEDYAIAFAKGNDGLRDAVDAALGELISDGTVEQIMNKYIVAD